MAELKPCPFCGGRGTIWSHTETIGHGSTDTSFYVCCKACGARTKPIGDLEAEGTAAKKLVAKVLWERRVEDGRAKDVCEDNH